jgi:hypothetical protein
MEQDLSATFRVNIIVIVVKSSIGEGEFSTGSYDTREYLLLSCYILVL